MVKCAFLMLVSLLRNFCEHLPKHDTIELEYQRKQVFIVAHTRLDVIIDLLLLTIRVSPMFSQKGVKFVVLLISELFLQVLLQMHITLLGVANLLLVKLLSY
jgi:hypothetical protein